MTDLDSIKSTLVNISKGNGILDMLMEFERTLDNAQLFAYKNWLLGEIVEGPIIERYFFKVVLMYPVKMMPDPDAGLRLTKLGGEVSFKKGIFKKPVRVNGPQDWADPETKRAKMEEIDIWLVTIKLPMKYINRGLKNTEEVMKSDIEDTNDELSGAFDTSNENSSIDDLGDKQ